MLVCKASLLETVKIDKVKGNLSVRRHMIGSVKAVGERFILLQSQKTFRKARTLLARGSMRIDDATKC